MTIFSDIKDAMFFFQQVPTDNLDKTTGNFFNKAMNHLALAVSKVEQEDYDAAFGKTSDISGRDERPEDLDAATRSGYITPCRKCGYNNRND